MLGWDGDEQVKGHRREKFMSQAGERVRRGKFLLHKSNTITAISPLSVSQ